MMTRTLHLIAPKPERELSALAILVLCSFGCSQSQPTSKAPGATHAVPVVFATESPIIAHDFRVENTTGVPVRLLRETHSCTCSEISFEPRLLLPGESTTLGMAVHVPHGYSKRLVGCTIHTDHPEFPEWTYRIAYESFPEHRFVPDRVDYGNLQMMPQVFPPDIKEIWFESYSRDRNGWSRPGSALPVRDLAVTISDVPEVVRLPSNVYQARYKVSVALAEPAFAARGRQELIVHIPTDRYPYSATFNVSWSTAGLVQVAPAALHFGMLGSAYSEKRTVVLKSDSGQAFRILGVHSDVPGMRLFADEREVDRALPVHRLELRASVDDVAIRYLNGKVRIQTDLGEMELVELQCSGFVRKKAESATSLDPK